MERAEFSTPVEEMNESGIPESTASGSGSNEQPMEVGLIDSEPTPSDGTSVEPIQIEEEMIGEDNQNPIQTQVIKSESSGSDQSIAILQPLASETDGGQTIKTELSEEIHDAMLMHIKEELDSPDSDRSIEYDWYSCEYGSKINNQGEQTTEIEEFEGIQDPTSLANMAQNSEQQIISAIPEGMPEIVTYPTMPNQEAYQEISPRKRKSTEENNCQAEPIPNDELAIESDESSMQSVFKPKRMNSSEDIADLNQLVEDEITIHRSYLRTFFSMPPRGSLDTFYEPSIVEIKNARNLAGMPGINLLNYLNQAQAPDWNTFARDVERNAPSLFPDMRIENYEVGRNAEPIEPFQDNMYQRATENSSPYKEEASGISVPDGEEASGISVPDGEEASGTTLPQSDTGNSLPLKEEAPEILLLKEEAPARAPNPKYNVSVQDFLYPGVGSTTYYFGKCGHKIVTQTSRGNLSIQEVQRNSFGLTSDVSVQSYKGGVAHVGLVPFSLSARHAMEHLGKSTSSRVRQNMAARVLVEGQVRADGGMWMRTDTVDLNEEVVRREMSDNEEDPAEVLNRRHEE